jgi:hypothetical protein
MSGSRTSGPTLAIGGVTSAPNTSVPPPTSFNASTGAMNSLTSDYVSELILILSSY